MTRRRLRVPLLTVERVKLSTVIVLYALMAEVADPRPFNASPFSRLLYLLLAVEVVRQIWVWRLEVSHQHVRRAENLGHRWHRYRARYSENARYRIRRAITILVGLYAFGWIVDGLTTRCTGAAQCTMLFPKIAVENLPAALQVALYMAIGLAQLFAMFYAMTKVGFVKIVLPGTIPETFDDVYGQDAAKGKVQEQVELLEDDVRVAASGGYMPKGILLHGPPGTGKTMLAKAAANASTKPLILVPPGAFASTFVGINFLKVWMLFRHIRKISMRHGGVIVFIDEIDSLGHRGGEVEGQHAEPPLGCVPWPSYGDPHPMWVGMGSGVNPGTLEAFLAAMDGLEEPRGLVNRIFRLLSLKPLAPPKYRYLMVGATNRVTAIDPALLRAGRFGRKIHVDYPNFEGRLHTYQGYLGKVTAEVDDTQLEWAARNHYRGTGAEIKDIVNEALLATFRDGRPEEQEGVVTMADLMNAMMWVKYGESEGQFENERNRRGVAIHEAGHALVFHYLLRDRVNIWFASVERRGRTGGMVSPSPKDDDWKDYRKEMLATVAVSLASRVAEQLVMGDISNGHGGDGPHATELAIRMVQLGHHPGQLGFYRNPELMRPGQVVEATEDLLGEALTLAEGVLEFRVDQLQAVADLLYEEGTVTGDRIHHLLDTMEAA